MRASSIIIGISILIIAFSVGYIAVDTYQNGGFRQANSNSFASLAPVVRQVMVIDINKIGIFTPELVQTGQLPILAISQQENNLHQPKVLLSFLDQIGTLINYDVDNNNRLDISDPIFSQLEIVYIQNRKIIRIESLPNAGVRQIDLDRENIQPQELFPNGPTGYWNTKNTAILANGSSREIRVIPIATNDLPMGG